MVIIRRSIIAFLAACCNVAMAEGGLEAFRQLDLNSYALGANLLMSSSPYAGIDDFVVVFPAPTSYGNAVSSDETFFVRDGDFGLRALFDNGWDVGGVLSVQTLGYGSGQSPALVGMSRRDWTIQGGISVGRHVGDFRFDLVAQTDLLGEHDGQEYEFKFARVFEFDNYYFMPQVDATYQTSALVDHYFGVTEAEAIPGRPQYSPGSAVTWGASLEWSWRWHRHWYVTAKAGIEWLPGEIKNSPVVDRETTWSTLLQVAYDAPSMLELGSGRADVFGSGIEIRLGAFFVNADSKVFLTDGVGVASVNLESEFALDDSDVAVPFNLLWRINPFHRLELGYFELKRSGAGDLAAAVDIGDVSFPAGEFVDTGFDTRIIRFGYAFSLFHDAQKELAVFGGAHISDIKYRSASDTDDVQADTTATLPVLGADLVVNFTDRWSLGAELQFFVSDVNSYSGNLIDFGLSGQYAWLDRLTIGAGYRFYRQDIDSADENFFGDYRFEYRGPFVFINARL